MIPLLVAFLLLALAFRRLFTRPSLPSSGKSTIHNKDVDEKSSAHIKLLDEAFEHAPSKEQLDHNDSSPFHPVLILYATEYGFALQVAKSVASTLAQSQSPKLYPRIVNVLHFDVIDFTKEAFIILICSTTGDGVPPNEAASFRQALESSQLTLSPTSSFSVLALGDRAYPHFCRAGAIFDNLLPSQLRILDRVDIDQEDWDTINDWTDNLQSAICDILMSAKDNTTTSATNTTPCRLPVAYPPSTDYLHVAIDKYAKTLSSGSAQYTRNNPYLARVSAKRKLTGPVLHDGHKEVVRIEFDISGSGITYEAGDAVGVLPKNNPSAVNRILRTIAANGDETVVLPDGFNLPSSNGNTRSEHQQQESTVTLETALNDLLDLAVVKPILIGLLARFSSSGSEVSLAKRILGFDPRDLAMRSTLSKNTNLSDFGKNYVSERHVIDVLTDFPSASLTPQQLVDVLRPLHARYYSISSTSVTDPDTIATTVDVLRYKQLNTEREGVASTFLQDRCRQMETSVPIFITSNPNFRLPSIHSRPIVMIGPGTGVAPFIGFIEERIATNAQGENWLFFGCRYERQDLLYKPQFEHFVKNSQLKLMTAFSRDSDQKVYVQHRMIECGATLWRLVSEEDAHVYVCGDGSRMAGDVDKAWRAIVKEHGGYDDQGAEDFMEKLADAKRYQRDVWVS